MNLEKVNFGYSLKNIPIPSNQAYLKTMIDKLENFINRLRWKVFFFLNKNQENDSQNENFGFKTDKTAPASDELRQFENDLYELIRNIEFKSNLRHNKFLQKLKKDVQSIKASDHLIVPADKTTNLYKIKKDDYEKLLFNNVTDKYKKVDNSVTDDINLEAKHIATKLKLEDRIEQMAKKPAFVTLKDHKDNFINNPQCRLINPAKSEIGKISKKILDEVNSNIRTQLGLNQWRSTDSVISWYKSLSNKDMCKFFKFDIVEFYPSISENLLNLSLKFAQTFNVISSDQLEIIRHCRKSVLFNDSSTWVKKTNEAFDVAMGSYDGAEVCELVGLFILDNLSKIIDKNLIGLYRDDGLAILRNMSGPDMEKFRKTITAVFKQFGLKITTESNLHQVDFLDVTFNLYTGKFWPFKKPNNTLLYVNAKSNHPKSIIKNLPKMIGSRISKISSSKEEFTKAIPEYQEALAKSGYNEALDYTPKLSSNKRNRSRNISWFNPPFSSHVKTNIGKEFLRLVQKHFNGNH